jgi:hypothetical protein
MAKHRLKIRTRDGVIPSPMFSAYTLMRLIEEYPFLRGTIDPRALEHEMGILQARIFLLVLIFAKPIRKLKKMKLVGEAQLTEAKYRLDIGKLTIFLGETPNGRGRIRLHPVEKYELQKLVKAGKIGNISLSSADDYLASLGNLADLLK